MTDRRMIAAAVWEDEFVGSLTFFERILWIGLIVACADDQGRMMENPSVIRSKVFLYDENLSCEKVAEALQKFVEAGKLAKYCDEKGRWYFQLINWWRYQSQQWPQPSKYPAPEGWIDRVRFHSTNRQIITENWDKPGGFFKTPLDSGLPSSLPRALPSGLGRPIEKEEEDEEEEREEDQERAAEAQLPPGELLPGQSVYPEWPRIPDQTVAEKVYQRVTGQVTFPGRSREQDIDRICRLYDRHRDKTVEYLDKFWQAWLGYGYNRVNTSWLDWAVADQVPDRKRNGGSPMPRQPDIGTDDPGVIADYNYLRLNPKGRVRDGAIQRLKEKGWAFEDGKLRKLDTA